MNSFFRDNGPTGLVMHPMVLVNPHSKNPMSNFHFLTVEWLQL
jgi:hypothetical protein